MKYVERIAKLNFFCFFQYLCMTLGSGSSPFLKTLLFFKRLEIEATAAAEAARNPRAAFLKNKGK